MENDCTYSISISAKASKELEESWLWYEQRKEKLGDRFIQVVRNKLVDVSKNPEIYPLKNKNYREAVLSVFPFVIVFKINQGKKLVKIDSVFHTSRNPKRKY